MSGLVKSVGGFLGLDSGNQVQQNNSSLNDELQRNDVDNTQGYNPLMQQFASGGMSNAQALNGLAGLNGMTNNDIDQAYSNLATNPTTGSLFASNQVANNPLFSGDINSMQTGLNDIQGQLGTGQNLENGQIGILNGLQSQGFNLQPQDQTLYGQEAGNIARQFGQSGNQISNDLAMRGLSSAPSGAAGAMFSGLNGNQNEQLAQAQQQIAQQRFQNTMNQIQQQQSFINALNAQNNQAAGQYANSATNKTNAEGNLVNQQYGRQAQGAQAQAQNLNNATNAQNASNNTAVNVANANTANTPTNIADYALGGLGSSLYNVNAAPGTAAQGFAGAAGKAGAQSLFGGAGG